VLMVFRLFTVIHIGAQQHLWTTVTKASSYIITLAIGRTVRLINILPVSFNRAVCMMVLSLDCPVIVRLVRTGIGYGMGPGYRCISIHLTMINSCRRLQGPVGAGK